MQEGQKIPKFQLKKNCLKRLFYLTNLPSLSLCFRFCILYMLDRKAKQVVHCCFTYWQQNCEINSECRIFIIDDNVIEKAQLDFQIMLHRSK